MHFLNRYVLFKTSYFFGVLFVVSAVVAKAP